MPGKIYVVPVVRIQVSFGGRREERLASTAFSQPDSSFQREHIIET